MYFQKNHENLHLHREVSIFPLLLSWTRKEKNLEGMLITWNKAIIFRKNPRETEFTSPVQLSGGEYLNFLVQHKTFLHP